MNADNGAAATNPFQKINNAVNQTLDNAAYNLNNILNGNSQNPYLATSAGPMAMDQQNIMQFSNAEPKASQFKATPPSMTAA